MRVFVLVCAVCVYVRGSHASADTDGVGAFAYQDSTGNRYGGTYGLKDGRVVDQKGDFPPDFSPPNFSPPNFLEFDDFFPEYFKNFENLLQDALPFYQPTFIRPPSFIRRPIPRYGPINRTFLSSIDQRLAYDAASKAYDLTSNQAGYIPNFASRFQFPYAHNFGGFGGFENMPGPQNFPEFPGFQMPNFEQGSSAFASAAAGPGFTRQMAGINPANPNNPNIDKMNVASGGPGFKIVSTSAHASESIGPDGKKIETRRAQTTVNENGKIRTYEVGN